MPAPRSLDPVERRAWRGFQQLRVTLTGHLARELGRSSGLTEAEYAVLVHVSEAEGGRLRARDLGRVLAWERSRLSHQLSRMEGRSMVRRLPCEDDARGFLVELTAEGRAAIEAAAPAHLEAVRHCFADVLTPAQLEALGDIAEVVLAHLDAQHATVPEPAAAS